MKQGTALLITAIFAVSGIGWSILFSHLADNTRREIADEQQRLAALTDSIAMQDSLARADSLARNIVTPDLAFHDLHGRVRDVSFGEERISFDRDGVWTNPSKYVSRFGNSLTFTRNKLGNIIAGCTAEREGGVPIESVEYDWKDNRVTKVTAEYYGGEYRITYRYDHHNRLVESTTVSRDDTGESDISTTYTYLKFDSYGNWTERNARSAIRTVQYDGYYDEDNDTFINNGEPFMDSSEELQRRSITYYD